MGDIPIGFAMALSQNPDSMYYFSNLPDGKKQEILSQIHNINSKTEMQEFVAHLSEN